MKWVWIRPLVETPQMKKVPNSTQNTRVRAASPSTAMGDISMAPRPPSGRAVGVTVVSP